MSHYPPRRRQPAPPPAARPGPRYSPYPPQPRVIYYPRRRRPNQLAQFVQGWLIGFVGGGVLLCAALATFVVLFPLGRTNVLILGVDRRPQETTFVTRTDTMILATVDPAHTYAGMLSIPRDLMVTLPDGSTGRINTAHFFAEADETGSGPAAAVNTVRSNFGVDVHRFVRIDLIGFVRIVDALGGVTIDVPNPLIDYEYPTYDYGTTVVAFEAGPQHMDGERALAYARIRHGSSDFQRAERQQLVMAALVGQALKPTTWLRAPLIAAAVTDAVYTDVSLADVVRMAPTLLLVGPAKLDSRVIQDEMVQPFTTDGGASVLLPVWENINPVLLEMFGQ
jgi:LCP family protein required for cell wall assembly